MVDGIPIEIQVTSKGDDHINNPKISVKAKPFEVEIREKVKKKIREIGPTIFYYEQLAEANEEAVSNGNYTVIWNKAVIRKHLRQYLMQYYIRV